MFNLNTRTYQHHDRQRNTVIDVSWKKNSR